ncbi:mitochondrial import inner membrane translocase subunit Tim9-like [Octodon degus]|uniref:Mitochondrial import inner membrane translocase subunit n=1 Tax=Octodon degus TaxID=10160 RepID=A0A6P6E683_OCTDE|nr:mitochondrial import inner membrane translocase subunit Tim9-like [Octodon degus]
MLSKQAAQISEYDQIKQFREFLGIYNKLTETCFFNCVKDFTREVKSEKTPQNEALTAETGLLRHPQ